MVKSYRIPTSNMAIAAALATFKLSDLPFIGIATRAFTPAISGNPRASLPNMRIVFSLLGRSVNEPDPSPANAIV
jgi:hypothetical protein